MSLLYDLKALGTKHGVETIQDMQRDYSPYLVHLTSYSFNKGVRDALKAQLQPVEIADGMDMADKLSFDVFHQIVESGELMCSSPRKEEGMTECVCLSECTLSGVLGHSERYGRFGFVFEKRTIFGLGGRPCIYVDAGAYSYIDPNSDTDDRLKKMFGLANVYRPSGFGQVQDFTHEREWRVFRSVPIDAAVAIVCPSKDYYAQVREQVKKEIPILPLDMLYRWCV